MVWLLHKKPLAAPLICFRLAPPTKSAAGASTAALTAAPPCAHRKVPLGSEPLGEVVEGVGLGAHWVAVPVDLVEQVGGLVQAVVADVHVLLLDVLGPPCQGRNTVSYCWSDYLHVRGSACRLKSKFEVSSLVMQHCGNKLDPFVLF